MRCHEYADDTQLYLLAISFQERWGSPGVQSGGSWGLDEGQRLKLNPEKTEDLLVRKSSVEVLSQLPTLNWGCTSLAGLGAQLRRVPGLPEEPGSSSG